MLTRTISISAVLATLAGGCRGGGDRGGRPRWDGSADADRTESAGGADAGGGGSADARPSADAGAGAKGPQRTSM